MDRKKVFINEVKPHELSFLFLVSSLFSRKEIFPWEHGNITNWGSSRGVMPLGLLLGEIPPNTHENIKGVVYVNS
jgi:hypothetical protein